MCLRKYGIGLKNVYSCLGLFELDIIFGFIVFLLCGICKNWGRVIFSRKCKVEWNYIMNV